MTVRSTVGPGGSGSQRSATSSIDALPQIPHDAVAMKCRSATDEASNGVARRTRIVSSGWLRSAGSPDFVETTSDPVMRPSGPQEPDRQFRLVTRRSHRDRDRHRFLAGAGGTDLERRLTDDPVVAELERLTTDCHDPGVRDVPDRFRGVVRQVRHVVASSARARSRQRIAGGRRGLHGSPRTPPVRAGRRRRRPRR